MLSPTELETAPSGEALPEGVQEDFLLWVGRLVPHKRPDFALRMFSLAADRIPKCSLVVVGSGYHAFPAYAQQLDAIVAELPPSVRERVLFFESLSLEELRSLYSRAKALLSTSAHEGFGMPLYEAMRFGLPILSTAAPGSEETLGGAAQMLPNSLPDAADVLVHILTDQDSLNRLRKLAEHRGQELFAMADGDVLWESIEAAICAAKGTAVCRTMV